MNPPIKDEYGQNPFSLRTKEDAMDRLMATTDLAYCGDKNK